MLSRIMNRQWGELIIWVLLVAGSAVLYVLYGPRAVVAPLAVALIYLAIKLGAGSLAQLSAGIPLSLRWKISGTIFLMLGVLLAVSLAGVAAINYTQGQIHSMQEFREVSPKPLVADILQDAEGPEGELFRRMRSRNAQMSAALDSLENTQHRISNIFAKLQVNDRTQAVLRALRTGLVRLPDEGT